MLQELSLMTDGDLVIVPAQIEFKVYEKLKQDAMKVAEMVRNTEVTEEALKEVKKELATVNKVINILELARKESKKKILEPYRVFETQIKEIVDTVKDAEADVRHKVRSLEEQERQEKRLKIADIWQQRLLAYDRLGWLNFEQFIENRHLNKTTSLKKVEEEMVEYLEAKQKDIETIATLDNANDVLVEYMTTPDLAVAIRLVNQRNELRETVAKAQPIRKSVYFFIIDSEEEAKKAEQLLKAGEIKFKKEIR